MHSMFDAAFPPKVTPGGYQVAAGYLGDPNFTPHIWTQTEWAKASNVRVLPIWTYNPDRAAGDQAGDCLVKLQELGFKPHVTRWGLTWRSVVALDLETRKVAQADNVFTHILNVKGWIVMPYGSASTVFANPAEAYWVADWTHEPHMFPGKTVYATQWTNGKAVDTSLVRYKLYKRLHGPAMVAN